jgi:hypothetical protein
MCTVLHMWLSGWTNIATNPNQTIDLMIFKEPRIPNHG